MHCKTPSGGLARTVMVGSEAGPHDMPRLLAGASFGAKRCRLPDSFSAAAAHTSFSSHISTELIRFDCLRMTGPLLLYALVDISNKQ